MELALKSILEHISHLKAVIFDMDGVLIDTSKAHEQAFKESLQDLGIHFNYSDYKGMSTEEAFLKFLTDDSIIKKLKKSKQDKVLALSSQVSVFPYADNLLKLLGIKGIKIGLATSGSRARTEKIIKEKFPEVHFEVIVTGEDVIKAKPHPEIYHKAISSLGLKAEECLVIEDASSGIEAAQGAGIKSMGILNNGSRQEIEKADFTIRDIYSLYAVFTYYYNSFITPLPKKNVGQKATIIISAAGTGTRLNISGPKILYKIKGKPLIEWMYEKVKDIALEVIVVANPEGAPPISEYIAEHNLPIKVSTIYESKGTADSVLFGFSSISNPNLPVIVLWGDQFGIKKESIEMLFAHYLTDHSYAMVIPTILKKEPYVHIDRDYDGKVRSIKGKRRGEEMPEFGENESGVFIANHTDLLSTLLHMKEEYLKNPSTSELDFLYSIVSLSQQKKQVSALSCINEMETIGLNTLEEAAFHEKNYSKNT